MTVEQLINRIDDGIAALEDLATAATRIANELVYIHDRLVHIYDWISGRSDRKDDD